jgi:hypothetical protein
MKGFTIGSAAALALVFSLGLAGCEKEKGPAEKLGAKIDGAASEAKEAVKEAADEIEDAAEDAKEKAAH